MPVGYESRYPYSDTGRMPLPEDCELPDPLDLLAWLAARTERIRLGHRHPRAPGAPPAPARQALRHHRPPRRAAACSSASAWAGCARRSRRSGIDPDERGARTDEAIDALRVIWQEDEPSFDGQHFRFGPVRSHPKPAQPTIPILVGGHSPGGGPPGRRARRRLLPARPERRRARRALAPGASSSPSRPVATRRRSALTMGGLLGDDDAIADAVDKGAERVVLSTRTADLDELRHAMDAAGRAVGLVRLLTDAPAEVVGVTRP